MSRTKKALQGLASSYALTPIRIISQLLVVPAMLASVGKETLALWYLAAELVAYLNLVESGNSQAALRYAAMRRVTEGVNGVSKILSTLLLINVLIGVVVFVAAVPLSPWLAGWYELKPILAVQFIPFFSWVVGWVALRFSLRLFSMVLRGIQEQATADFALGVGLVVKLCTILLCLQFDLGLLSLIFGEYSATVVEMVLSLRFINSHCPGIRISLSLVSREELRGCFSYSTQLLLLSIPSLIINNSSSMIIAKLYGPLEVTIYNVTLVAAKQAGALLTSVTPVLMPALCELYALEDRKKLSMIVRKIMPSLIIVNLIVFCIVGLLTEPFVGVWVGQDKFGGNVLVCLFMGWFSFVATIHPLLIFMRAEGNLKGLLAWAYPEAILVVFLSVSFGQIYGLDGIALGLLVSHLLTTHHYLWRWAKTQLNCGMMEIAKLIWQKCLIVAGVFLSILYIDNIFGFQLPIMSTLIFRIVLCAIGGITCFFYLAIDKNDRKVMLAKIGGLFNRQG